MSADNEKEKESGGLWLEESLSAGMSIKIRVHEVFLVSRSPYQRIEVVDLDVCGRSLILDGVMQSCEVDEKIYHESLVLPSLLAHPNPKSVFIGGGGEGATAREALRFKSVEKVEMVDLDLKVVEASKKFLPKHHRGSFDDPRMHLHIADAEGWLREREGQKYDVIILDLPDPLEDGPCWRMYTKEFYDFLLTRMNPHGILVTQCGPSGPFFCKEVFSPVYNTLKQTFPHVRAYSSYVPSFQDTYGFCMASVDTDLSVLNEERVRVEGESRVKDKNEFYDAETHTHMFALPKSIRDIFAEETRVGTLENPQCFYKVD